MTTSTPLVVVSSGSESGSSSSSNSSSSDEESVPDWHRTGGNAEQPRPDDVLLGRGKKHHTHPGNARFAGTLQCVASARSVRACCVCGCLCCSWYLTL
jgi:hypothetical protein